jgi:hypothetical protein
MTYAACDSDLQLSTTDNCVIVALALALALVIAQTDARYTSFLTTATINMPEAQDHPSKSWRACKSEHRKSIVPSFSVSTLPGGVFRSGEASFSFNMHV